MFHNTLKNIAVCSVVLNVLVSSATHASNVPEYYVKGLFLLKVLNFVQWPEASLDNIAAKKVCVYGEDPFSEYQAELGATIEQHVIFQYLDNIDDTQGCHVLFISLSERYDLKNILSTLAGKPILTVSDIDRFAFKKGMIELSIHPRRNNIQLNINLDSVKYSGIKLSSNLVELASKTYGQINMEVSE